jgi:hypothetical protein
MSDEKTSPDELTKPTTGDVTLTEADLNDVSGGAVDAFLKIGPPYESVSSYQSKH